MSDILAGQASIEYYEGLAADLPEVEPAAAELEAIETGLDELIERRISELTVQVARYGHHDELDARRFRHIVRAELRRAESLEVAA